MKFFKEDNLSGREFNNVRVMLFERCDLREAKFENCDLRMSAFENCDLSGAVFINCNMNDATISCCSMNSKTKFINCSFDKTRIELVDLKGAEFIGTNLSDALLGLVHHPPLDMFPSICPESGAFTGYKVVRNEDESYYIAELYIPEDARRVNYYKSRKCRASKAKVVKFYNFDGNELDVQSAYSSFVDYRSWVQYIKGEYVYPDKFDDDRECECSSGIHFFMTFDEAVEYIESFWKAVNVMMEV